MSFEIYSGSGRTEDFSGSLYQIDGVTALVLLPADELRCKIGVTGNTPLLDLVSTAPTANGSAISITTRGSASPAAPAGYLLHLAEGDMVGLNGAYDVELLVVDSSTSNPPYSDKQAATGILYVLGTMTGNLNQ